MSEDHKIPLCVDLDGTLIRTDALLESLLQLAKQKPWAIILVPFWLVRGRAFLKEKIAKHVDLLVETLPYQSDLVEHLKKERKAGRSLILVTASPRKFADGIAQHLGFFTKVHATEDGGKNLSGHTKKELLVQHYGIKGFDYAGNSRADIPVWSMARAAIVVNPRKNVLRDASKQCPVLQTFQDPHPTLGTYARALRVHQWLKNILVFVPLVLAHQISSFGLWANGSLAFISFSLCASSLKLPKS